MQFLLKLEKLKFTLKYT